MRPVSIPYLGHDWSWGGHGDTRTSNSLTGSRQNVYPQPVLLDSGDAFLCSNVSVYMLVTALYMKIDAFGGRMILTSSFFRSTEFLR